MKKNIFAQTKYFILDMDGTFYLGGKLIDGSKEFIERVFESGRDYRFFTNNSSNNVEVCRAKLARAGFPVGENRIIISSHVAASYLNENYPGKKVFLLGNERLVGDFRAAGVNLVEDGPDIVVLGFDTSLTYQKIWDAVKYIDAGAEFFATHPDVNCPVDGGYMPDVGAMIELFAASTGRRPTVLGKPATATLDYITKLLGCRRGELAFVGDRLETDIAIAANHSVPSALVFSGVTTRDDYAKSDIKASAAVENLKALAEYL